MRTEIKMKVLKDHTNLGPKGTDITVYAETQADYFESAGIAKRTSKADVPAEPSENEDGGNKVSETTKETKSTHTKSTPKKR